MFPPKTTKSVSPDNKCDICNKEYAIYYDTQWYIHYCSMECFNQFIQGYNKEIDEIAIEMKTASKLFDKGEKDEV